MTPDGFVGCRLGQGEHRRGRSIPVHEGIGVVRGTTPRQAARSNQATERATSATLKMGSNPVTDHFPVMSCTSAVPAAHRALRGSRDRWAGRGARRSLTHQSTGIEQQEHTTAMATNVGATCFRSQATPSSVPGSASSTTRAVASASTPAVLVAVAQPASPSTPPAWRWRPTSKATRGARGLRDPTHQRRPDGGGAQEAHGVERHDPAPHGRLHLELDGGVGRGDEGDGQAAHEHEGTPATTSVGDSATAPIITLKAMPTPVSRWMLGLPRLATMSPPTTAPPAMSEVSSAKVPAPPWNVSWASSGRITVKL